MMVDINRFMVKQARTFINSNNVPGVLKARGIPYHDVVEELVQEGSEELYRKILASWKTKAEMGESDDGKEHASFLTWVSVCLQNFWKESYYHPLLTKKRSGRVVSLYEPLKERTRSGHEDSPPTLLDRMGAKDTAPDVKDLGEEFLRFLESGKFFHISNLFIFTLARGLGQDFFDQTFFNLVPVTPKGREDLTRNKKLFLRKYNFKNTEKGRVWCRVSNGQPIDFSRQFSKEEELGEYLGITRAAISLARLDVEREFEKWRQANL